jgi:D-alanyl-D-alanine carboxypeptidase (penicillin-binding protein 5/6)
MRRWICILLAALTLCVPAYAAGAEAAAPSYVLMDAATGTVLLERDAHERLAPASVTKVMTLLLVMEALDSGAVGWDDAVVASEQAAAKGGSQVYLEPGESMSMTEMLKSVAVSSANDCAAALADHVAGSEAAFVERMNARAAELGMDDTHFVNCTGLDDGPDAAEHRSSAYDIAVMSRELLSHDKIRDFTTIWTDTVRGGSFGLSNTNKLVRFYRGCTGLKTGYTSSAGHCLSASAERDGMELIAVVLHCASSAERFASAKALLDYGFANYALVPLEPEAASVPIRLGTEAELVPVPEDDAPILAEKSQRANIRQETELFPEATAPIAEGQQLGTLRVYAGDDQIASVPLVAPHAVDRLRFPAILRRILEAFN